MSLAKRIIPCLDVDHGRVLKGTHFRDMRDIGNPVELAKKYRDDGADELVFLDITASIEKRKTLIEMVRNVASNLDIPFTVGGGIRSVEDVKMILSNGADKISINTAAVENPLLIKELVSRFGQQCVVVAIDGKRKVKENGEIWFEVYTYGGTKPTGLNAIEWAKRCEALGAGELLITSIDKDGTKSGYDLDLTRMIAEAVNIPIIASGGCGEPKHILDVLTIGKADAALAASIFHYDEYPIPLVKRYLKENGVNVRL
ncbi:MAG: imidazole glycerol phosphate synthase subunit HisF [Nitrososphaerales archaeon]